MRVASKIALLCLAAPALAKKSSKVPLETWEGSTEQCVGGRVHTLNYKTVGESSISFVDLDSGDLGDKLSKVTCDIDHTRLQLEFHNSVEATDYFLKFHDWNDHFVTGGSKWGCKTAQNYSTFVLRRVVGASQGAHLSRTLTIETAMARYDEVFETANIAYATNGACDASHPKWANSKGTIGLRERVKGTPVDKKICLGYNTDCSGSATAPIPLYSDPTGKLQVSCSDCWAALQTDVFVNFSISGFSVNQIAGGFRNSMLNASMVVDASASAQWNVGIDKTLSLVAKTYVVDFKVGPVPFMLFFEIPVEVTASLQFNTAADLTLGTNAGMDLGSAYVSWDPTNHWTHTSPTPNFDLKPKLSTKLSGSVDTVGNFGFTPTFNMYFDRVFSYSLKAAPTITAEAKGDIASKQICLTSSYALDVEAKTEVDININIIDFHKDWTWGPTSVYQKSGVVIPQTCVSIGGDE